MLDIRCTCPRHPLLARGGKDANGKGFVHVKTWKRDRIYAEVVIVSGVAHIHCRDCSRWHTVRIVEKSVEVKQEHLPPEVRV